MSVRASRSNVWLHAILVPALLLATGLPLLAEEAEKEVVTFADAIRQGDPIVNLRYRYEGVSEAGWSKDAGASTIRAQIGYKTAKWNGLWMLAEYQGNFSIPATQYYNSTANGQLQYPVVADPVDQEMAEAFLAYSIEDHGDIKAGLQKVNMSNQRYVGSVAWRQLEQIFSGATYKGKVWKDLTIHYGYLAHVTRVFGEHTPNSILQPRSINSNVLDVSYKFKPGTIHGYVHLFDLEDWNVFPYFVSHKNVGLRFDGSTKLSEKVKLLYTGEYAKQSDYQDSPDTVDADYGLLRLGVKVSGVTVRVGYEMLGGDGTYSFQTPFATLHKFNGWADRFLTTPPDGLKDTYIDVGGTVAKWKLLARYHSFDRDNGDEKYGKEFNALGFRPLGKMFGVGLKYARYDARADVPGETPLTPIYNRDVDKFWLWLQMKL
jgi:hypothetical protein